uniref:Glucanase n=1 Tax=Coniochaeta hoffmannii TaxID=91930 RepID=A0A2I7VT98_9PEZI|nr:glycoside hydrolase family 7 protein [Coniochaeta hoffmannii]
MSSKLAAVLPLLLTLTTSQKIGTAIPEVHPRLTTQACTTAGGCVTRQSFLVTDALSRPLHATGDPSVSCNPLNTTLCPDAATCAQNCELEGVEYGSIGVATAGSALTMRQYLFDGTAYKSVSPRLYLLAEDGMNYEMLKLAGQELTYDVDVSQLGCGMNGALYLSEMEASGSRSDLNPAGAQYGTGYCDAQCFNTTFIGGLPNLDNSGSCCNEMDIWEANSLATALTPHTCSSPGPFLCAGDEECGKDAGVCDKSGCGINPFSTGAKTYYGPGLTVDTAKPFTVVTQFVTADGTPSGELTEIRRLYVQGGRVIPNAGVSATTSGGAITQDFCTSRNASSFLRLGGMAGMGAALGRGMVLVFSIWNSEGNFMNWLDSGANGPCSNTSGDPALIVAGNPDVSVTFSNIRWGDIGSTFNATGGGPGDVVSAAKEEQSEGSGVGMRGLAGMGWVGMAGFMGWFALFW